MSNNKKIICENRKARHEYYIEETYEAGIALRGTEVKSLRQGKGNLKDSYARIENGEIYIYNCHISPYTHGNILNHDPLRRRKLLLHKRDIKKLYGKIEEKGLTLIPLRMYFSMRGIAKLELAVAKGKKTYDKRETLKRKTAEREMERALKDRNR